MKPVVFDPQDRPQILISSNSSDQNIGAVSVELVEMHRDYFVVVSDFPLSLRGQIKFQNQQLNFAKKIENRVDELIYTQVECSEEDSQVLVTHYIARLSPKDLTNWLIDSLRKGEHPTRITEQQGKPGMIGRYLNTVLSLFYRQPILALILLTLISIVPAMNIKKLVIDPSLERIHVQGTKELIQYEESVELFGSDKAAILFFQDPDIFTKEKLKILRKLAWDLQRYPKAQTINSIFTTSFIRAEDDSLYTEPAFSDLDISDEKLSYRLAKLKEDPLLHGRLIHVEKNIVVIAVPILHEYKKLASIGQELKDRIAPLKKNFQKAYITGEPAVELFAAHDMKRSQVVFLPAILIILLISFCFFIRSFSAFWTTFIVTTLSTFWTFGLLPLFNTPIQVLNNIAPGIVLTLCATEIIHIFSSLKSAQQQGKSGVGALAFISHDVGRALILTFTTTSLGFLSIYISEIQLLKEFAITCSLALCFAFVATIIYFPLHLRFFGQKVSTNNKEEASPQHQSALITFVYHKFLSAYYNLFFSRKFLFSVTIGIVLFSLLGLKLEVDNDAYAMISNKVQTKKDILDFTDQMGGTKTIHVVIKSKQDNFKKPLPLRKLWDFHKNLEKIDGIVHLESYASMIALMNKEITDSSIEQFKVPKSENLIAQYMLSLNRDDLDPFISSDGQTTNLKIRHDVSSSQKTKLLVDKVNALVASSFSKEAYETHLTSRNILNLHAAGTIVESQLESLLFMIVVIVVLLGVFFKSLKVGLYSLIPNLFPICGLFGFMALFDMPLNFGTSIVAAITIGIAADDTIHLFSRYFQDKALLLNPVSASKRTIKEEVVPILTTSLSLSLSFLCFSFARYVPLIQFGVLSAFVLVLAVFSDLYIGPAVLTWMGLSQQRDMSIQHLIEPELLLESALFHELSMAEIYRVLECSDIKTYPPGTVHLKGFISELDLSEKIENKSGIYTLLKGSSSETSLGNPIQTSTLHLSESSIVLKLNLKKIGHLSPRIFSKICHNLKA
jgi:predicted RND superfamily exporter protein